VTGRPKIGDWVRDAITAKVLQHVIKINLGASNWGNRAFTNIYAKAGGISKTLHDLHDHINITFDRAHKNSGVITSER
jgi:hypothetical protein